jgi:hypothetical protein
LSIKSLISFQEEKMKALIIWVTGLYSVSLIAFWNGQVKIDTFLSGLSQTVF